MTKLLPLALEEGQFEMHFIRAIIRMDKQFNFTEIYNQIRAIENVVVVSIVKDNRLDKLITDRTQLNLLEIKFVSKGVVSESINSISKTVNSISGVFKFYPVLKSLIKIRNY